VFWLLQARALKVFANSMHVQLFHGRLPMKSHGVPNLQNMWQCSASTSSPGDILLLLQQGYRVLQNPRLGVLMRSNHMHLARSSAHIGLLCCGFLLRSTPGPLVQLWRQTMLQLWHAYAAAEAHGSSSGTRYLAGQDQERLPECDAWLWDMRHA
jgi:hypothetical protein